MTQRLELRDISDYELEIQKVYEELELLQQEPRSVSNAEELEGLEQEIRQLTNRLGSLLLGKKNSGVFGCTTRRGGGNRPGEEYPPKVQE